MDKRYTLFKKQLLPPGSAQSESPPGSACHGDSRDRLGVEIVALESFDTYNVGMLHQARLVRIMWVIVYTNIKHRRLDVVYAVHVYYLPVDQVAEKVMNRLGVRW